MRSTLLLGGSLVFSALFATGAIVPAPALLGDWKTADGSAVRTYSCGQAICMKIIALSPTAPGLVDYKNPDASLRTRQLCNLEIGSDFTPSGDNEATGGSVYDPLSGKTYKGNMALKDDMLRLRGYVGFSAFGRTEMWQRISDVKSCR